MDTFANLLLASPIAIYFLSLAIRIEDPKSRRRLKLFSVCYFAIQVMLFLMLVWARSRYRDWQMLWIFPYSAACIGLIVSIFLFLPFLDVPRESRRRDEGSKAPEVDR